MKIKMMAVECAFWLEAIEKKRDTLSFRSSLTLGVNESLDLIEKIEDTFCAGRKEFGTV